MLLFLQLFIDGEHIGDGATVVQMNETGDLEEMLAEFMVKYYQHVLVL
jgi:glutaredoxin-related protein